VPLRIYSLTLSLAVAGVVRHHVVPASGCLVGSVSLPHDTPLCVGPGGTEEYGVMVDDMMQKYPDSKFIAVGFSMGGNIVVKYLGEHDDTQSRIIGAISCCQGYNLVE